MKKIIFLFALLQVLISCNNNTTSSEVSEFKLFPVKSGEYWGYIDREGKFAINPQFKYAYPYFEGLALVQSTDGKYGYIDEKGSYIINPQYQYAVNFSEGLALTVKENGKLEYINSKGEVKISLDGKFEAATNFYNGLAAFSNDKGKAGFIDAEGNIVIQPNFSFGSSKFKENFIEVVLYDSIKDSHKYGYVNKKSELVIPYQFYNAQSFSKNGLAVVSNGDKYGYIDTSGKYVINPQFSYAGSFENDLAIIQQGELMGVIDKTGKIVINPQFKSVESFYSDVAVVQSTDGKYGYIDKTGKFTINPQFDYCSQFYNGIAVIKMADKYGLIDKTGKIIVNPQFDEINLSNSNFRPIENQYFDVSLVANYIVESISQDAMNGYSAKTTFKDIQKKYPDFNENNYWEYRISDNKHPKYVALKGFRTSFNGDLTSYKENFTTQKTYSAVEGGYVNKKVSTGYSTSINPNITLKNIDFVFDIDKSKTEIVKPAIISKIKSQGYNVIKETSEFTVLKSKNTQIVFKEVSGDIWIYVTFGQNNFEESLSRYDFSENENESVPAVVDSIPAY